MKKIYSCLLILIFVFCLAFWFYKPVIFQEGDPRPLLKAVLRLNLTSDKIVQLDLDGEKYLTKSKEGREALSNFLKPENYQFVDQMGSGYFFVNDQNKILAVHKYYSRFYSIWSLTKTERFGKIDWLEYRNEEYGFTFRYPSLSISGKWWGNYSNEMDYLLPNQVLSKNNNFYLHQKYETEKDTITGELIKTENTFIPEYDYTYRYPVSWHIVILEAENEADLDKIIKQKIGPGCSYKNKIPTEFAGNYKIEIEGDGLDPSLSKCYLSYTSYIIFSPNQKKVAFWSTDQECQIGLGFIATSCFDEEIAASFHFFE